MSTLYSYFRSSAAYRVRIALNLKGLDYEIVPVHLVRDGGEQLKPAYRALNVNGLVPTFVDGEVNIHQSLAIIEYLEDVHPTPALLPADPVARAQVRALALDIAADIHPIDNLRVLRYLKHDLGVSEEQKNAWYVHWVVEGFTALEARLAAQRSPGKFVFGDTPTLADCCLVPQVYNANRFKVDMTSFPRIAAIDAHCQTLDAFRRAAPEAQPDAE
ncbi:maleylacetoacetate isomerase [Pandoraea pnomenusa]|uniref:maleylacetoacetate isomerase n=1 Tax=Pandoraea pnomenusa TaxID=93220 RepID=UPI00043756B0|nr:maleylacetoacetate isomerase [Pandoraea pnomenusa]AHN75405.1 maleylacetoacetate isomerase [Pandoraea pnomenusa]ANC45161.1 maleylacetoacetate isomerase [Pandoraea pnomenusa]QDH58268.1 maleylacetoacetate isomerase [Pandoraea pnomenusa]QDX20170.1 maleylacetoacetate isomerase [Pandoraea pnomenusa]